MLFRQQVVLESLHSVVELFLLGMGKVRWKKPSFINRFWGNVRPVKNCGSAIESIIEIRHQLFLCSDWELEVYLLRSEGFEIYSGFDCFQCKGGPDIGTPMIKKARGSHCPDSDNQNLEGQHVDSGYGLDAGNNLQTKTGIFSLFNCLCLRVGNWGAENEIRLERERISRE